MRWRPVLLIWGLTSLLSVLWSFATPIGAAPDEPAHFIRAAAVARGEFLGTPSNIGTVVHVPAYVGFTQAVTCFAFQAEVTADCSPTETTDPATIVKAATTAGLYNPVYYALVGWPSLLFHDQSGLYAMRVLSGILSCLFLALAGAQLLALRRRAIPLLAFLVAVTPMVLFLGSTLNPNALEVTATLSTFVTMFLVVRHPDPALLPARAITVLVSASVAVTMRGLSPLWVVMALFLPLLLARREELRPLIRSRWAQLAALVIGVAGVFAVVWILVTNSLGPNFSTNVDQAPGLGDSPLQGFLFILFGTFGYAQGLVGVFGWLDTPAPLAVFFTWSALIGLPLLLAVALLRGRARALLLTLLVAIVLLPPALQAIYIHGGGIIWQGRYALPVYVCLVMALGLLLAEVLPPLEPRVARTLVITIAAAWGFCQVYSFGTALRRYSVGLTGNLTGMLHPTWNPPGGILPLTAVFTIVCGVGVVLLIRRALAPSSSALERDDEVVGRAHR